MAYRCRNPGAADAGASGRMFRGMRNLPEDTGTTLAIQLERLDVLGAVTELNDRIRTKASADVLEFARNHYLAAAVPELQVIDGGRT